MGFLDFLYIQNNFVFIARAKTEKCKTLYVGEKVFGRLLSSAIPNVIRHDMTRSPAFPPPWQGTLPNLDLMEKPGWKTRSEKYLNPTLLVHLLLLRNSLFFRNFYRRAYQGCSRRHRGNVINFQIQKAFLVFAFLLLCVFVLVHFSICVFTEM